jgi:hypothetical protein
VEAIFYPYEAILFFLSQARSYIQWANPPDRSEQEREAMAREKAVEMTLIMVDSFHQRSELMMDSFISEIVAQWRVHQTENIIHFTAERGDTIPRGKNPEIAKAIKNYSRELTNFWKYHIAHTLEGKRFDSSLSMTTFISTGSVSARKVGGNMPKQENCGRA